MRIIKTMKIVKSFIGFLALSLPWVAQAGLYQGSYTLEDGEHSIVIQIDDQYTLNVDPAVLEMYQGRYIITVEEFNGNVRPDIGLNSVEELFKMQLERSSAFIKQTDPAFLTARGLNVKADFTKFLNSNQKIEKPVMISRDGKNEIAVQMHAIEPRNIE